MGLLDEAIRDHLELKRRRGADPTEIARAEREALEPVFPAEQPVAADAGTAEAEPTVPVEHGSHGEPADSPAGVEDSAPAHHAPPADPAFATLGQETAELDVEAYMEAQAEAPIEHSASAASDDELIEWEDSAHAVEPPPEQIPGQERLSLD